MDINVTLFGEMITFGVLVWVTMKFVWPPLEKAMLERQQKISAGLEAAARGERSLELSQENAAATMREAKVNASMIIEHANQQAINLVEEAKSKAKIEGEKLLALTKNDINQEITKAKKELTKQMGEVAIKAAEKIIRQKLDSDIQRALVDQIIEEI